MCVCVCVCVYVRTHVCVFDVRYGYHGGEVYDTRMLFADCCFHIYCICIFFGTKNRVENCVEVLN